MLVESLIRLSVFALAMLVGWLSRGSRYSASVSHIATIYLLYLVVPLAVFRAYALHGLVMLRGVTLVALAYVLSSLALWRLASGLVCGGDSSCRGALIFAAVFQNAVFLPLALLPILGLSIDVIASYSAPMILVHFTLGLGVAGGDPRRWLRIPAVVTTALVAGLAAHTLGVGCCIAPIASALAAPSGYVAAYVVGVSLPEGAYRRLDAFTLAVLAWRHVVSPALHAVLAAALGVEQGLETLIVESVMPPATMNVVIARHLGLDAERVAAAILLSTPIGVAEAALASLLLTR